MYESLLRIIWRKFVAQLEESGNSTENLQNITDELSNDPTAKTFQEILSNDKFNDVMHSFNIFFEKVKLQGSMSEFWVSYITMVKTLLDIIRASREGNFLLHLQAVEAIIPWCFSYDRTNYSRYLPWYIKSMRELESENPKVWEYLCNRGFSVQLSTTNSFGRIPMDQTIEETVNKDTQTTGGTKGFSLNPNAVARYYITADFRSSCLRQIRQSINSRKEKSGHPDLKTGRIRRDERDIHKIWDLFQTVWKDPFDEDELCNLATAVEASLEVKADLLGAYDKGIKSYDTFIEERFINKTKKFDDKIPKMKLKTFDDMNKKAVKVGDKVVEMKVDRNLFAKMAIIAQSRKLPMREVMSLELGPHPYSLASNDSMPRKTNKATVGTHLEPIAGTSTITSEDSSACLIDMMSFIQKLPANFKTFSEISKDLFQKILNEGKSYDRIDAIFDVYRDISIKTPERVKRGEKTAPTFSNIVAGIKITQWARFLKNSKNKSELIKFLVEDWKKPEYCTQLGEKKLYIGYEEACIVLTRDGVEAIDILSCRHEEADTRLIFHASHAANNGHKNVVLVVDDTDVMIIGVSHASDINGTLFQKRGNQNRTQLVNLTQISTVLGQEATALLGVYAFTGCDSVSSFAGKGKLPALKQMKKDKRFIELFHRLGQDLDVTEDDMALLEEFVCVLYGGQKLKVNNVSELRYLLFCAKGAEIGSHQLPPSRGCLIKHILRANYQAYIWRRSLDPMVMLPGPEDYGWKIVDDELAIDWTDEKPAPDAVIDMLSCKCRKPCNLQNKCSCHENGLPCTDMCKCTFCENKLDEEDGDKDGVGDEEECEDMEDEEDEEEATME